MFALKSARQFHSKQTGGKSMSKIYGYARISSRDQHEDRQLTALNSFGVDIIFVDKQSGKNFDRPQYKKLLRKLKPNDVLVVKSIDRLGRNYTEILEQWCIIATTYSILFPKFCRDFPQIVCYNSYKKI